jgi:hypothetical protein
LLKISELKQKVNETVIEIQQLRAETEIKDNYIEVYNKFITSLNEDFGWCGACMSSCFVFKNNQAVENADTKAPSTIENMGDIDETES